MPPPRIQYQTIEFGDVDIHVRTLRDNQQFEDTDDVALNLGISSATWPLFGIVWNSSRILAQLMQNHEIAGKRILEVGCGIALPSLMLNHRLADITATDYHPEVEEYLNENTLLNNDRVIPFLRTGWGDDLSKLGTFDLIIGSDVLYEQDHIELLSEFIDQHTNPDCEVIIIDPGRRQRSRFSKKMVSLNYSHEQVKTVNTDSLGKEFSSFILSYRRLH